MEPIVNYISGIIWSNALIALCLGVGLFFTIATRFLQIRHIKDMAKYLFSGGESAKGFSSFQAFAVAVSGRVGTGNIAGVATAIAMGGPGAVFWMWAIAFLGAGSAFVESTLAQIYKVEIDGQYRGGPAYYIEKGLKQKWYAVLFAVSTILGTGLFLPGIQSNSIGAAVNNAFGIDTSTSGAIIVILLGFIIFGGFKRIGHVAQWLVPLMTVGYILVAAAVIAANISKLPEVFALIFRSAFAAEPAFGGMLGMAISWGVKRGIYSNEAGQGTGPMAAAAAEVSHPAKQGLVQAFSVYFDTWFVCTATAVMILITGVYNVSDPSGGFIVENMPGIESGPAFTQAAVDSLLPGFGSGFIAFALFFFAFTTLMAYYYYTETNIAYLWKGHNTRVKAIFVIRLLFLAVVFFGTMRSAAFAWALGDIGVGLMAWLNIVAILILCPPALHCLRDYEKQKKNGQDPVFKAKDIGITNTDLWK
ncbi:MAG: alanine:cation symporter family protein [Opitutales bacterium]|nr:alanine:cation symporter family protein [Opitutales bacterium]MDG2253831.1 alanine/glycine:cation symporter family protein [Opitutaceae bacterium]